MSIYSLSTMANRRHPMGHHVAILLILAACDFPFPFPGTGSDTLTGSDESASPDEGASSGEGTDATSESMDGVSSSDESTSSDPGGTTNGGSGLSEATSGLSEATSGSTDGASESNDGSNSSEGVANLPPRATDDVYLVRQGESLVLDAGDGVLSNDIDPNGDSLTASLDAGTTLAGTMTFDADGALEYTPANAWWGEESFTYTANDGHGEADTARVRIVVRPVVAPLASVTAGVGGFAIDGEVADDRSGISVSGAGDVNGDGLADLMIGAGYASPNGVLRSGRSYVVFGKTDGQRVALSQLTGSRGFVINGEARSDFSGRSVSGAGDVNGDGLADVIVGASLADPNELESAGRSYVVFGKTDGDPVELADLALATETRGFTIDGRDFGSYAGVAVSAAGDVNGDGLADVIVGAYREFGPFVTPYVGRSYVVFGKTDASPVPLSQFLPDSDRGFSILGENQYDYSGRAVSGSGDVNGDGFDDVLVSSGSGTGYYSREHSYVVFGKTTGTPVDLAAINNEQGAGFLIDFGSAVSVSVAGDVNGDGLADLIVGSESENFFDPLIDPDDSYVVFGKSDNAAITLGDIEDQRGFVIDGEGESPRSAVSGAGDLNGDGLTDLIVGFPFANPNGVNRAGRTYVIFGKTDATTVRLSEIAAGEGGFVLEGEFAVDVSGSAVGRAGDVNADGFDDLIVGARLADPNGPSSGRSYVIFGGDFTLSATFPGNAP